MTNITNPQALAFTANYARPQADTFVNAYYQAKKLVAYYNANAISTVITNDTSVIVDGAATDGRPIVTGADAINMVNRATEFINLYETGGVLATVLKVAVNIK